MPGSKRSLSPGGHETGRRPSPAVHTHAHVEIEKNTGVNIGIVEGARAVNIYHHATSANKQKEPDLEACLESLKFQGMNSREANIPLYSGTCDWLLQHKKCLGWRNADQGLLWIIGHPGSGKSTLICYLKSKIIENKKLEKSCMLSFLFNARGEHLEFSQLGFLRTILYQLLQEDKKMNDGSYSTRVKEHFFEKTAYQAAACSYQWQKAELERSIENLLWPLAAKLQIYLLVDALDEAGIDTARDVAQYLSDLVKEARERGVYLRVCFSCRHWPLLNVKSAQQVCVEDGNAADIENFVNRKFNFVGMASGEFDNLKQELIEKAKGIFQWVSLVTMQITSLYQNGESTVELFNKLKSLPGDLFQLYESLLDTITNSERALSIKLFQWICYSARPLKPVELRYILALDCRNPPRSLSELENSGHFIADRKRLIPDHPLLKKLNHLSRGLVEVSKGKNRVVQVIHKTVGEYLQKYGLGHLESITPQVGSWPPHWQISRSCLQYLSLCQTTGTFSGNKYSLHVSQNDFLSYSLQYWFHHICKVEEEHLDQSDLVIFFDENLRGYLQKMTKREEFTPARILRSEGWTLLQLAVDQSLYSLVRVLIHSRPADINYAKTRGREPLALAFQRGDVVAMDMLLKNGQAEIRKETSMDILEKASSEGHEHIIRLLYDRHVIQKEHIGGALIAASKRGQNQSVQLLLELGADAIKEAHLFNALQWASRNGHDQTVGLLVDNVTHYTDAGCWDHALLKACRGGHENTVRLLIDRGANVKPSEIMPESAIHTAASEGHEQIVRLLLESGADINQHDGEHNTALYAASNRGRKEVLRLLLAKGADVNATGGIYENALQAASKGNKEDIVRLLLEGGAKVNAQGGLYGNALQAASIWNRKEIVRLLLKSGADVKAQGGEYGTALQAASYNGGSQDVRLLLEQGADVNAQGGRFGNALQAASYRGSPKIVRLLLGQGALVNAQGGPYNTALQAAAALGYEETTRILLEQGAEVNAQGGKYGNALQAASYRGKRKVVQLLLEQGANVNTQGGEYGNAFRAALQRGHGEVARLLLWSGANVEAQEEEYGVALERALDSGDQEIVQLLIERGMRQVPSDPDTSNE